MKQQVRISVIVTSYNYEKYIKETLDSLIGQSLQPFEIIVVDDGSKDRSLAVIESYTSRFEHVKLYTHPGNANKGLAASVKMGIEKAGGEYIAFCESDDYWADNHMECLQDTIRKHPKAHFIANGIKVVNLSSNPEYDSYIAFSSSFLQEHSGCNIFPYLNVNYIPTFSAVCVKKETLQKADFNTPYPAWLDFWLWRQICVFNEVYYIPKELTFWRKHDKSYDATAEEKDFKGFLKSSDLHIVAQHGLNRLIANFHSPKKRKNLFRSLLRPFGRCFKD